MKWFCHQTDLEINRALNNFEEKFGDAGYAFFYKTLELCYRKFNENDPEYIRELAQGASSPTFRFNAKRFASFHGKRLNKVVTMLNFSETLGLLSSKVIGLEIHLKVPKLLKFLPPNRKTDIKKLISNYHKTTSRDRDRDRSRSNKINPVKKRGGLSSDKDLSQEQAPTPPLPSPKKPKQQISDAERFESRFNPEHQKILEFLKKAKINSSKITRNVNEILVQFGDFENFAEWAEGIRKANKFQNTKNIRQQQGYFVNALLDQCGIEREP